MMKMSKTITPSEFAVEVDSDGRTVRKFLRATMPKDQHPGKGSRWALPGTKRDITRLTKQFQEWSEKQAREAEDRAAKREAEADEVTEVEDEVELDD